MIVTELYKGQGLGNQLFPYIMTRVIALDNGYEFGIKHPELFKGKFFTSIDFGNKVSGGSIPYEGGIPTKLPDTIVHYFREERLNYINGADIRTYDNRVKEIKDNTKIDGLFQGEDYFTHRKNEIREWLKVTPIDLPKNLCIVNFRGGEYVGGNDLFLPLSYWNNAIAYIKSKVPGITFKIVTDDVEVAREFFPEYEVSHDRNIANDYVSIQYAEYLILSNSSFAIFPAWLNQNVKIVVAPKYWARHKVSDGYWSVTYNIIQGWLYMDTSGNICDYQSCIKERDEYMDKNKDLFWIGEPAVKKFTNQEKIKMFISRFIPKPIKKVLKKVFFKCKSILVKKRQFVRNIINNYRIKITWLSPLEINKYRKNIKIYDIFTFFNEFDLLEIRLNILDQYVDYFVIIECSETFSGLPKPLYYEENKNIFKKWEHKILHYVVTEVPKDENDLRKRLTNPNLDPLEREIINNNLTSDNVPKGEIHWLKEFYQKESIKKALVNLGDDDICFISDVDEIWNPNTIIDYTKDDIFKLRQNVHPYYLDNRSSEPWAGTLVTKYKNIRNNCLNHLRTVSKTNYTYIKNGGWHFTNQGGAEQIKKKIESYGHQEFNNEKIKGNIENKILKNEDFIGRRFKFWVDKSDLPQYILDNKEKYTKLFKS